MSESVLQTLEQAKQRTTDHEVLFALSFAIREIKHLNDLIDGYKRIARAQ